MHLTLWIVAGLLALIYLVSGIAKLVLPRARIAGMLGDKSEWAADFSPEALKAIGAIEVLAAIGLVVPALVDIAPVLVPLAAAGLVVLMAGAALTRLRRGERKTVAGDLLYLALAAFVAWGRFGPESFTS